MSATDVLLDCLPPVATADQVAKLLQRTPGALAQDRYLGRGVPFIKMGKQIRYLRADVLAYLEQNQVRTDAAAR
ncbi:DNA-binding protein [Mycolicibacterium sp. P9-64]|uniref:helix-turn-helix domain-containing protein n=1 Tax=Mycolicibacterium sp. P9-64 TaxID=2024612 RepID=UPI0011EDB203|nr:helix-turn-helix domain-containing protein [Mycolicibacterium sp. P9-64]KAA0085528.1 DNA-binding protein [Mycolicibacterium sp. P9-64]